ncbi:hypothetical protein C4T71_11005 [Clostridioides difficile]
MLACAWRYSTLQVEVSYPYNSVLISDNRKGLTAFVVFLLSFFVRIWRKPSSGAGCRSPPTNLSFSKKSD